MDSEFKIETGIPAPPPVQPRRRYPFRDMAVGDSFFAANVSIVTVSVATRDHRPKKFTCRTVVENGIKGVRAWRIA